MNLEQLYDDAQKLLANNQHHEAYKTLKKLDAAAPNHPGILYMLGICQSLSNHKDNAIQTYRRVLKLQPNFVEAMNNLGLDLKSLGRHQEALIYFDLALELHPSFFDAQLNKSSTLLALDELQAASELLVQLLPRASQHPMVLANLGIAHLKNKNPEAALEHFESAQLIEGNNLEICRGYLSSLALLKRWEDMSHFAKEIPEGLKTDPKIKDCLLGSYLQTCNWPAIKSLIADEDLFYSPFNALCLASNAPFILNLTTHWTSKNTAKYIPKTFSLNNKKIRVGYISSDFRTHALAFLACGLFQHHDRTLFEVHGIAIDQTSQPDDKYRQKISAACDQFHELGSNSNRVLIEMIQKLNLDALIDLSGHTNDYRTSILSTRCAPVQIQYLGFPGTTGAPYIDYTIGDPVISPQTHFKFYSEKIISLPECFQVNDDQRKIKCGATKSDYKIPDDAFVFACFNQQSKLTQELFDVLLRILSATPKSILWLIGVNDIQKINLNNYAQKRGLDPCRLLFSQQIPYEEHLGRYALVDLALDTYPFNGGATTSDALWGGAPVVTITGDAYSSRMSASLLHSVGLDELAAKSLDEYEKIAIELALNPKKLSSIRDKLKANLRTSPAFNTERFTRHFEAGLTMAIERSRQGHSPEHIFVPLQQQ